MGGSGGGNIAREIAIEMGRRRDRMGRSHRLLFDDAAGADDTHGLYHSRLLCRHLFDVTLDLLE